MQSRKWFAVLSLVMVFAMVLTACSGKAGKTEEKKDAASPAGGETVKIGVVTELTGEKAASGKYVKAGVQMAVDQWNAKGGIGGKKIELVFEDDTGQTTGAVNAFNKVMSSKPVAVIGPIFSNFILAMEPYVRQAGVPVITGGTNVKITSSGNPWFFRVRTSDGIYGKLAAKYATENLKLSKVAILHDSDEFGSGGAAIIKKALGDMGKPPVAVEAYNSGDKDFSAQLLNIKKAGAEIIIAWGHPLEAGLIYNQIAQLGLKIKVLGSPSFGQPDALKLAKELANGHMALIDFSPANQDPMVQDWLKAFKQKSGLDGEFMSSSYYDGTNMLLKAIEKAGTSPEGIRKALLETQGYKGVTGEYSFESNGDGLHQVVVMEIKDQKPSIIAVVKTK